jgi:TPR repeat protein
MLIAVVISGVTAADAAKRVALVVGNNKYDTLPGLNNARKDAESMAARLRRLGFDVILKVNASKRDLGRAMASFESKLGSAEVGLVFYAGHGIQSAGKNFLIPSDAQIEIEEDLRYEGIDAGDFLDTMNRAGSPLNIVILDACRDNPLPRRTRSAARGLNVPIVPTGLKGTAIVYSAAPGQTAQDGPRGGNGVFTGELLKVLGEPGLKLEDVFKKTAARVNERTSGRQRPWFNSSVTGDFYFKEDTRAPVARTPAPRAPMPKNDHSVEIVFWQTIQSSRNVADFKAYLSQFPNGTFSGLARNKLRELDRSGRRVARRTPSPPARRPKTYSESADAQFRRAYNLHMGKGVKKDLKKAIHWYKIAAERGHSTAQLNLANRYYRGEGVPRDRSLACKWYEKSARQNEAFAQSGFGLCHQYGYGRPKNLKKAVHWYRKAADQGYSGGQNNLANRYYKGEGVPKSYKLAYKWYSKAAAQGSHRSQHMLGVLYHYGYGVSKNINTAVEWYRKSAAQGNKKAKAQLKTLGR